MVGIAALACVSIFGLLSTIASSRMVDEVNEKLSKENQFGQLGGYWSKTLRLHREYNRLYPAGQLSRKVRTLYALAFTSLLICAWCLGFFGK